MDEYIKREALLKKLFPYGMPDNGNYGVNAKAVRVTVEKMPAADVVEVVRCKDCIFNNGLLDFGDLQCRILGVPMKNDDFCSYGEKTDG